MALISPFAFFQLLDDNGDPLAGGKLSTFEAGTSTPKETFTDSTGNTGNANPVILDADGRAGVWLGTGAYKFVLTDSADVEISTVDNIIGDVANVFGSSVQDKGTNYTVVSGDQNSIINCTSGLTVSLLDTATAGEGFVVGIKNSSASGTVTIDPDGLETIDSVATVDLEAGQSALVVCTGTAWLTMFQDFIGLSTNNSWTGTNVFAGTTSFDGKVTFGDDGERTISSGSISITGANHTVDTESDAASDDLDTISTTASGLFVLLRAANASRTVVIKHDTGNIYNPNLVDITLDEIERYVGLLYDNDLAKWVVMYDGVTKEYVDDIVSITQVVTVESATYTDSTTTMPYDDTIPQNTEGEEILTQAFTPKNASSTLIISVEVPFDVATATIGCVGVFVDSAGDALGAGFANPAGGGGGDNLSFSVEVAAGSTSLRTYKVRAGAGTAGNMYINGSSTNRIFGGISKTIMKIEEVLA